MMTQVNSNDVLEMLNEARLFMEQGEHEKALEGILWFHQHALQIDPALKGVRLSFALRDWLELARQFEPAKLAYLQSLSQKHEALVSGRGTVQDFVDLCAMNERMGLENETYATFQRMLQDHSKLAEVCMPWALSAALKVKDFELAKRIYGDPEVMVESILEDMHDQLSAASKLTSGAHQLDHACVAVAAHELRHVFETFQAVEGNEKLELLHRRVRHLSRHTEYGELLISEMWKD